MTTQQKRLSLSKSGKKQHNNSSKRFKFLFHLGLISFVHLSFSSCRAGCVRVSCYGASSFPYGCNHSLLLLLSGGGRNFTYVRKLRCKFSDKINYFWCSYDATSLFLFIYFKMYIIVAKALWLCCHKYLHYLRFCVYQLVYY